MERLKKCPFCGTPDVDGELQLIRLNFNINPAGYYVSCFKCGCRTEVKPSVEAAHGAWNTRAAAERKKAAK